MSERWYAVWTKPRQEARAAENLARQAFEVWLPKTEEPVRRGGRQILQAAPMFPRYLFIRADAQRQSLAAVRSSRGCADLVRLAGRPAVIPDAVVEHLQRRCDDDGVYRRAVQWEPGEELEILDGPFAGLKAIYQASSSSERVQVLLQWLGAWQRATLPSLKVAALA